MTFLPKDFKEPTQSNYMDFQEGDNTFRVLDEAVLGWEYWRNQTIDGEIKARPVRVKEEGQIPVGEVLEGKYGLQIYFFWAFPVFNFNDNRIQILVIKQKTVRRGMLGFIRNAKWGDPKDYNFVVTRGKDESGKTIYTVMTEPKEALDKKIIENYKKLNLDMQIWFACGDPFSKKEQIVTPETVTSEVVADDVPF
jgi:hypothetical protein